MTHTSEATSSAHQASQANQASQASQARQRADKQYADSDHADKQRANGNAANKQHSRKHGAHKPGTNEHGGQERGSQERGAQRRSGHKRGDRTQSHRSPQSQRSHQSHRSRQTHEHTSAHPAEAPQLAELYDQLSHVSIADEHHFRRRLAKARSARARTEIAGDIAAARTKLAAKIADLPRVSYPEALPVSAHVAELKTAIEDNQVVIIAGETGSGKTTQIPKMCLELGRGTRGMIGHTQPRRLAARTVAERIASELDQEIGQSVGYAIRFDDHVGPATAIKLMTDGILLAEMQRDRYFRAYDTIIIDEAHERSLNIDFLLGYLKRLLPHRPDLKVIITSATIDPERFAQHFAGPDGTPAPIIEVSGRTYPVEIRYRPVIEVQEKADGTRKEIPGDPLEALCDACEELMACGPGDILCFFSGEREIRDAAEAINARAWRGVEVSMLFGRLSNREQHRVFSPHRGRRIVLATNIAETSLTVPGIHYVVDTGQARISRYSARTKVQRLPVEPISQASANQRSGRCGRIADGVAIRLYAEEDFNSRPEFTDPEILRTNLASVILQMAALRLGDIAEFPFIDAPDARAIRDGLIVLHELGALGDGERDGAPVLTRVGRDIARIPVDPRLARILVEAKHRDVLEAATVIVAALSLQDIRERPTEKEAQADQAHARFTDKTSDFLTYLALWAYLTERREALSGNAFRRLCRDEYLHYMRSREWMDLVRQLRSIEESLGWEWDKTRLTPAAAKRSVEKNPSAADMPTITVDADSLHRAIVSGMLSHIGLKDDTANNSKEYRGARGTRFLIFPGSGLAKKPPAWIVASEIVETSRMFARDVAAISPQWVEEQAAHLLKHQYSEPHWSTKRQAAMAYQKSTLFGLPIVTDRLVPFHRVDPYEARQIFIRSALVEGQWDTRHEFFRENREKLQSATEVEEKARRRGLVIDDDTLFDFYDQRLPETITTGRHFDAWWKKESKKNPHLLDFDPAKLLADEASEITEADFPDRWRARDVDLDVSYRFEPGTPDDGVSIRIPLPLVGALSDDERFDWLVPGLRLELVTALIRTLPKPLRTTFVPAPAFAEKALEIMSPYERPLPEALADALRRLGGVGINASDFRIDALPAHLRMNFQVIDRHGKVIDQDRDIRALKQRQAAAATQAMSAAFARNQDGSSGRGRGDGAAASPRRSDRTRGGKTASRGNSSHAGVPHAQERPAKRVYSHWSADTLGEIPESVDAVIDGQSTTAYPALKVSAEGVEIATLGTKAAADAMMFTSELTLLLKDIRVQTNPMVKGLPLTQRVAVDNYPHGGAEGLVDDCRVAAIRDALIAHGGPVRSPDEFQELAKKVNADTAPAVRSMVVVMARNLVPYFSVTSQLAEWEGDAIEDMKHQLEVLLPKGAVSRYGIGHLQNMGRYLSAMEVRVADLDRDPDRDADRQDEINDVEDYFDAKLATLPHSRANTPAARDIVFMIQELRVSLFAERLGTAQRVSPQRIRKAIDKLR